MDHAYVANDSDKYFIIDPVTRIIKNNSNKIILIKLDHNSEEFTFEIPRIIDGHDMTLCNRVEVHFINLESGQSRRKSAGVYEITNSQRDNPENGDSILYSWLIGNDVTKYAGSLSFMLRFAYLTGDVVDYSWSTSIYSGVSIADGIFNSETAITEYTDILQRWFDELKSLTDDDIYVVTGDGTIINICNIVTDVQNDIININEEISNVNSRIDLETEARETSHNELSGRINSESESRENSYSELSGRIDSEITSRENADSDLSNKITSEISNRETAINSLISRIVELEKRCDGLIPKLYSVSYNYDLCQITDTVNEIKGGSDFSIKITCDQGFELNRSSVSVTGATSYILQSDIDTETGLETGTYFLLVIGVTDNVSITISPITNVCNITYSLTNCQHTHLNSYQTTVKRGNDFVVSITCDQGFELTKSCVTVTGATLNFVQSYLDQGTGLDTGHYDVYINNAAATNINVSIVAIAKS